MVLISICCQIRGFHSGDCKCVCVVGRDDVFTDVSERRIAATPRVDEPNDGVSSD
jgi:hypothetical protein